MINHMKFMVSRLCGRAQMRLGQMKGRPHLAPLGCFMSHAIISLRHFFVRYDRGDATQDRLSQ